MNDDAALPDRQRYLAIYLRDHRAGAEAGVRLAERCRDQASDPTTAAELSRIVGEIDEDRRNLATIMAGLDVEPSTVKQIAGMAAERLGRLKLNGRVVRTSPLSELVQLEALVGAVSVKRELWSTLQTMAVGPTREDLELERLIARADDQRARLQSLHERTARRIFGAAEVTAPHDPGTTAATPSPSDAAG